MEEIDAVTVCVISTDMVAFLDKADRESIKHEWDDFCEEGSCPSCSIREYCQEIARYGMVVDRNDSDMARQVRDRIEIIFDRCVEVMP
jgi:hypothetical protein